MFVVDTNVLVYGADIDCPEHAVCDRLLSTWSAQETPWYATWPILFEFLRITTHPRVWRRPWTAPRAWGFVESLLDSRGFQVLVPTPRHREIAALTLKEFPWLQGNLMHDAHIVTTMREHGITRIFTRDADFHRFPFLEVLDPLARDP